MKIESRPTHSGDFIAPELARRQFLGALLGGGAALAMGDHSLAQSANRDLRLHHLQQKALTTAAEMANVVRELRRSTDHPIDPVLDPFATGLVGIEESKITSIHGTLLLKQLASHPDWAGVLLKELWDLGLRTGDTIAVTWTGSLPGANLALAAAMECLELRVVSIGSVCSSQYGANIPELTWLHMERELFERGLLRQRSIAAAPGGANDAARSIKSDRTDPALVAEIIRELKLPALRSRTTNGGTVLRLSEFSKAVGGDLSRYKAMVNVGGSGSSIGGKYGRIIPTDTIHRASDLPNHAPPCVLTYFSKELGLPTVNLRWLFEMHIPSEFREKQELIDSLSTKRTQTAPLWSGSYRFERCGHHFALTVSK